jgi:hypothetical protein
VNIEIDRFPVADLPDRYSIGRTALYERMGVLGIKPEKQGNKSYVSGQQLQALDDLDGHIKRGGVLSDFSGRVQRTNSEQSEKLTVSSPGQLVSSAPSGLSALIEGAVESLVGRLAPLFVTSQTPKAGMRLAHLRELEEAYEKRWLLSTSETADLLGLSVNTIRGYGDSFEEAGFVFTRSGNRSRGEIAWKISKVED